MDIQAMISDFLFRLKEEGIKAKVSYCFSGGKIISFEITIIGYYD